MQLLCSLRDVHALDDHEVRVLRLVDGHRLRVALVPQEAHVDFRDVHLFAKVVDGPLGFGAWSFQRSLEFKQY